MIALSDTDRFEPAIDAHVHLMPERLMRAIQRALNEDPGWSIDHPVTREPMEKMLREQGVRQYFALPYAHKPGIAEDLNRFVLQQAEVSDMVIPFATVHGDDPVETVVRRAYENGAAGLKFQCPVQQCGPTDPRLQPAFELTREYDRSIVFHASSAPHYQGNPHIGVEPFESFVRTYPDIRVCCAHMGAFETEDFLALARTHDSVYLDTTMAMSRHSASILGFDPATIPDETLEELSTSILYGSDFPNIPYPYRDERGDLLERNLTREAHRNLFQRTARRFLGRE